MNKLNLNTKQLRRAGSVRNATLLLVVTLVFANLATTVQAADFTIDKTASKVKWEAKKVTGQHNGTINFAEGVVAADKSQITGGTFVIDMKTIVDTDLTDAEWNKKLIGHLESDDFFGVLKFPVSRMEITKVSKLSGDDYHFTANLTIKGISNPVEFDAKVNVNGNQLSAVGVITVNRTKFDIRYGSKSFFPSIGDKMIYDDFTLAFEVVAQKK